MIEALIRTRTGKGPKAQGDVICVKLPGSPWGGKELRSHQLVEWSDEKLEAQLLEMKWRNAEPFPVVAIPYAEYDLLGAAMKTQSTERVDVDALASAIKSQVTDRTRQAPKLATNQYQRVSTKVSR